MKKLFMALMAVATIAMIGCKKDEPAKPTPTPGGGDDPEIEIPEIAAPGAGKTTIAIYAEVCPRGAYIVGNFTDVEPKHNYDIDYDGYTFEAVPDAKNWYAATIVYAPDRAVKAIARPSVEAVPFSWSYQWGPNFDEAAETPLVADEAHNNTFILKGTGEFELENQGEVKLIGMAENAVVYVQVKNWKSSPIVEKQPLTTAWAKTSWDKGSWTWREMTAKGGGVFEITGVWGGDGFNISATEAGSESWYPVGHANFEIQEGAKAGDEIKLTFTSEYGTVGQLKLDVIGAGADVPAGNGTFTVTVTNPTYEAGDVCIFTGNFEEKSWGDSDRNMTYDAGTGKWSWTGDYPKNFKYKVIYKRGEKTEWAAGDDVIFDGTNFDAEFAIQNF